MQLNVTGHHVDVTPALREYIATKVGRLERHFENMTKVHVVLSVEKLICKAEANIHVNGADLFAQANESDMYAAIDALADKLDRQLVKHKEKLTDHR